MAYTAPTTRVTDEVITASIWNTDVANNISFLANPPKCHVTSTATQSLTNGVWNAITFNTEVFDTDNMHSTLVDTNRITINTAGTYLFVANIAIAAHATGLRGISFWKNTVPGATHGAVTIGNAGGADWWRTTHTCLAAMSVGDFMEVRAYQQSGAALNTVVSEGSPYFQAIWQSV